MEQGNERSLTEEERITKPKNNQLIDRVVASWQKITKPKNSAELQQIAEEDNQKINELRAKINKIDESVAKTDDSLDYSIADSRARFANKASRHEAGDMSFAPDIEAKAQADFEALMEEKRARNHNRAEQAKDLAQTEIRDITGQG